MEGKETQLRPNRSKVNVEPWKRTPNIYKVKKNRGRNWAQSPSRLLPAMKARFPSQEPLQNENGNVYSLELLWALLRNSRYGKKQKGHWLWISECFSLQETGNCNEILANWPYKIIRISCIRARYFPLLLHLKTVRLYVTTKYSLVMVVERHQIYFKK